MAARKTTKKKPARRKAASKKKKTTRRKTSGKVSTRARRTKARGGHNGGGQNRVVIDPKALQRMAAWGATREMMADLLGVARSTLQAHIADDETLLRAIELGESQMARGLMVSTLSLARKGSATAMRYWLENRLGWRRHKQIEISGVGGGPVEVTDMRGVALARLEQFLRNQE